MEGTDQRQMIKRFLEQYIAWILLLAIAISHIVFARQGIGMFNSDEATFGLTSLAFLDGHHPVFLLGQAYLGTIEPFVGIIPILIWGTSIIAIKVLALFLFMIMVVITFMLVRDVFSKRMGILYLLFILFSSPALYFFSFTEQGHIFSIIAGSLILYLLFQVEKKRYHWGYVFAIGLLAGFGLYTDMLILEFLLPTICIMILRKELRVIITSLRSIGVLIVGFCLGISPEIIARIVKVQSGVPIPSGSSLFIHSFHQLHQTFSLFRLTFDALFANAGIIQFSSPQAAIMGIIKHGIYLCLMLAVFFILYQCIRFIIMSIQEKKSLTEVSVPFQFVFFLIGLCSIGFYLFTTVAIDVWSFRYLFALAVMLVILFAYLSDELLKQKIVFAAFLLLSCGYFSVLLATYYKTIGTIDDAQQTQAIGTYLMQQGITVGYMSYWDAYILDYLDNGKVSLSAYDGVIRDTQALKKAQEEKFPAYIIRVENKDRDALLIQNLRTRGYTDRLVNTYYVFTHA